MVSEQCAHTTVGVLSLKVLVRLVHTLIGFSEILVCFCVLFMILHSFLVFG